MLRENGFEGMLTRISTKRIREKSIARGDDRDANDAVVLRLTIRHVDGSGAQQTFVNSLESKVRGLNVRAAFAFPIQWKSVSFDFPQHVELDVDFDDITFTAVLTGLKARRSEKRDQTNIVYDLEFQKEVDPSDSNLYDYLGKYEENEDGMRIPAVYAVALRLTDGK